MTGAAPPEHAARPTRRARLTRAAGALLPWRLFFGPVFQKEMRVSGRKLGTYLARAAYALVLALVVSLAFVQAWEMASITGSPTARIQSLQNVAPTVVVAVIFFQFFAVVLLAPVMTGGAICDERRAQTLPTLLTTPLTALQIVCAKIASCLVRLLILSLLALPILFGVRLFGGVRAETIIAGAALTTAAAVLAAAVGVLASTLSRRATIASLLTYIILGSLFVAPPLLMLRYNAFVEDNYPLARLPDLLGPWAPDWPASLPMPAILGSSAPAAMIGVFAEPTTGLPFRAVWVASTITTLALALLTTLLAAVCVRGAMRRAMNEGAPTRRRRRRRRRAAPQAQAVPEPARLVHRRSRTVSDHPVFWRELRQPLFNRKRTLVFAIVVLLVVAGLVYPGNVHDEALAIVPIALGMILLVLQSALLSAPGFTAEREARTLDVLLTSRLRPAQLVWGKTLGAVRKQWFIPLVIMLHAGVLVAAGAMHWLALVLLPAVMLGPIIMLAGTGTFMGLRFRKSVTASATNLALALALWLAWPILMGVLFGGLEIASYETANAIANVTVLLNPVAIAVFIADEAHTDVPVRELVFDMPIAEFRPLTFTLVTLACATAEGALGVAAALAAQLRFARYTNRPS